LGSTANNSKSRFLTFKGSYRVARMAHGILNPKKPKCYPNANQKVARAGYLIEYTGIKEVGI